MPRPTPCFYFVLALSLLVGVGRLLIPGHSLSLAGSYEALAHVWVGVLLTLGFVGGPADRRFCWGLLAALTVLETALFLAR